jgi:hypothetical protein
MMAFYHARDVVCSPAGIQVRQGTDGVIGLPIRSIGMFSMELEKRDMLVPADILRVADNPYTPRTIVLGWVMWLR